MKPSRLGIGLIALATLLSSAVGSPVIFTADTFIAPFDGTFDGQDIIVSNAVLTVDGPHGFASLRLVDGAILTHTPSSNGLLATVIQTTNEAHLLAGTNASTLLNSNVNTSSVIVREQGGPLTYTNGTDYTLASFGGFTAVRRTDFSTIPDGATVLVSYQHSRTNNTGLNLNIAGDLEVEVNAAINATGRGYSDGLGLGRGSSSGFPPSGGGGGLGGFGGVSSTNAAGGGPFGSEFTPVSPGGCGGNGLGGFGAAGGGIVRLVVGSNVVLSGTVTVNGLSATNSRSGGGAGGSVWLTAQTISGNGTITANGGAGEPIHGGGGGGGRIVLESETNLFSGTISAVGGNGWQRGGAGTVLLQTNGTPGRLIIHNGDVAGAATLMQTTNLVDVTLGGGASALVSSAQTMRSLLVRSNSSITTTATNNAMLTLTATGNVTIEDGANISVNGRGFLPNQGGGAGQVSQVVGSGAGHGGFGGSGLSGGSVALGGNYYGSTTNPATFGSGGRTVGSYTGGSGGGVVRLTVAGNLRLDGRINADGTPGLGSLGGGASGGSVWLTLGGLSGAGMISANGGSGGLPYGGGGAGGRIAVTYTTNSFSGTINAAGGAGAVAGAAGTIYSRRTPQVYADLLVNNAGQVGTNTILDVAANYNLTVSGGAALRVMSSTLSLGNLNVGSNSTLLVGPVGTGSASLFVNVSNVTVATGGRISGDGLGASSGSGLGAGAPATAGSTGGGHGGYGGRGAGFTNQVSPGGNIYDVTASPNLPGSGGGSTVQQGGAGGAALRMNVAGDCTLNGSISVNGLSTSTNNAGGGSGGSVWLSLNRFMGSGTVAANGGSGHLPFGGGGGGGRIAITWNSNSFIGNYSAKGGNGFVPGGAGTIYLRPNQLFTPDLIFDNGGVSGTSSVLDVSSVRNLTVGPGVILTSSIPSVSITSNLNIGANGTWRAGNLNLTVGTVNIAAGGTLSADFTITSSIGGSGPYNALGSGGGGHGGFGGRGAGTTGGGYFYGPIANPQQAGGPGGSLPGAPSGSPGGGVLRMTVGGMLVVNGRISANGFGSPTNNNGGGAGGSIWLTLNQLSGSGVVSANGGSGHLPNGGGGSGGCIAIYYTSNAFTGSIQAIGGNGFVPGAAGTVYLQANQNQNPNLIVDNGGLIGTNTLVDLTQVLNFTIGSGASVTSTITTMSVISNLSIRANSAWRTRGLNLTAGTVNIEPGCILTADAVSGSGPGVGQSHPTGSGGGGHGGYGGQGTTAFGGNVYGLVSSPTLAGSPGGNSGFGVGAAPGGGALRMTVSGPLTLNGRISANGSGSTTNNGGGGSGGSVWLMLNQFSGAGHISTDGGSGYLPNGGGGGGGRIAITWNSNAFTGSFSAKGGSGFVAGGAGTIYLKANNQPLPNLTADNGGLIGTNTAMDIITMSNLTVSGGARLQPSSGVLTLNTLTVATNSALLAGSRDGNLTLNISGAATVAAGGRIWADGLGATSQGLGGTGDPGSGGGGHGGYGGRGAGSALIGGDSNGGNAFDSLVSPAVSGGRGGGLGGGVGGGVLRIMANGPFTLDGIISANGLNTSSNGAGGGAGGSVWLTLNELIGKGSVIADGGSGHMPNGGGGGGGRISVSYNFIKGIATNSFTGLMSARGGAGYVRGGAGTMYVRTNGLGNMPNVFVDNGGVRGTNTLVSGTSAFDLYVSGGAVATSLGNPRDVFVRSNAWLAQTNTLIVSRNATFDAGGGMDLNGLGNATAGRGSTSSTPKGGGGHGGNGAVNPAGAGEAYDVATTPVQSGSSGGNGSGSSVAPFGGTGGGATRLIVSNTFTLNGEVSADGKDGDFNSGGGSGGSVWIQAVTLVGNGLITATGGNGNGTAGGGAGGRIALYFTTNQFTGLLSACGGSGGAYGGAGSIYVRDNLHAISSLTLANCGNWGASTPISQSFGMATNLVVTGGAMAEMRGAIPIFSNLLVSAGGVVTSGANDTNLSLALLGNLSVAGDAGIITDAKGFARDSGPGYGGSLFNQGAGGSYGGWGGDSASGAWGGSIYGSASRPVDRGSGGGSGSGYPASGSEGGGAIRLAVAGTIELNGLISANGGMGWQDDAGGGSGGSIWLSARKFTGNGTLAAIGGDGDLFGGGGGGGGRIAIYSPTNTFTGFISAIGGDGATFGTAGTIFNSGSLGGIDVIAQTPSGIVSNIVSQVALEFTEPVNLASVSAGDVRIYTPYGLLPGTNQSYSLPAPATLLVSFNPQNVPGNYRVEVGPLIEGLLAPRMSQVYTGAFSITLPMISGTVTNLAGQPVSGVTLSPSGGLMGATTDATGNYSIGVAPGWVGTITPVLGTNTFVPGLLSYTNVNASVGGQNYLMVATIAPELASSVTASGLSLSWNGISGVLYQPELSTNLVNWLPYGPPLPGTNGLMQLLVPTDGEPLKFVRLRAMN